MEFLEIHTAGSAYREQLYALYERAFPEEEKKPQALLEKLYEQGREELLAVVEEDRFIGLAINTIYGEEALLDYFAIEESYRSSGYGGKAIRALLKHFEDRTYIFEIEMQDPTAENAADRARRKAFYLRNGLKETNVFANIYHTDFELLTPDGNLTYEKYIGFLRNVLGDEVLEMLRPSEIKHAKKNK